MTYDRAALWAELTLDEGRRSKPYRCSAGHLTIGIGRNLDANGLRASEIDLMLENDIRQAEADLDETDPDWRQHSDPVQRAMLNLVFNLGRARWAKFKATRAALAARDYAAAGQGLRNSLWYRQVQERRRDRIVAQVEGATPLQVVEA